jgi:hypothetical protein
VAVPALHRHPSEISVLSNSFLKASSGFAVLGSGHWGGDPHGQDLGTGKLDEQLCQRGPGVEQSAFGVRLLLKGIARSVLRGT